MIRYVLLIARSGASFAVNSSTTGYTEAIFVLTVPTDRASSDISLQEYIWDFFAGMSSSVVYKDYLLCVVPLSLNIWIFVGT